jgi:ADP-heptose:LPS heptosyltransferase
LSSQLYSRFQPQRILIVEFGTVRDVLRTLPIINILRIRFPLAKIAWFVNHERLDFLSGYQVVDRLIIAKASWYAKFSEAKMLRRRLQAFAPDFCLDLHGTWQSGFASWLSGSRRRISFTDKSLQIGGRLFTNPWINPFVNIKVPVRSRHELEKRLQLLDVFDVAESSIDYDLPENPNEKKIAAEIRQEFGLDSTPFALLGVSEENSGTSWDFDRYVRVARHLGNVLDMPTLVVYQNEQEKQVAENVVGESGEMVFLSPTLSAIQFTALARRASIYVGSDSDFLHIAAAVGTPTIGIFRTIQSQYNSPYCDNFQLVRADAAENYWRNLHSQNSSFQTLNDLPDVAKVCDACDEILQLPIETEWKKRYYKDAVYV